jgi:hypothetical protein
VIELNEYTKGVAGDYTRQSLSGPLGTTQVLPTNWSFAANTANEGDDEFRAWEALSDEVFDSWEESLKKRQ